MANKLQQLVSREGETSWHAMLLYFNAPHRTGGKSCLASINNGYTSMHVQVVFVFHAGRPTTVRDQLQLQPNPVKQSEQTSN